MPDATEQWPSPEPFPDRENVRVSDGVRRPAQTDPAELVDGLRSPPPMPIGVVVLADLGPTDDDFRRFLAPQLREGDAIWVVGSISRGGLPSKLATRGIELLPVARDRDATRARILDNQFVDLAFAPARSMAELAELERLVLRCNAVIVGNGPVRDELLGTAAAAGLPTYVPGDDALVAQYPPAATVGERTLERLVGRFLSQYVEQIGHDSAALVRIQARNELVRRRRVFPAHDIALCRLAKVNGWPKEMIPGLELFSLSTDHGLAGVDGSCVWRPLARYASKTANTEFFDGGLVCVSPQSKAVRFAAKLSDEVRRQVQAGEIHSDRKLLGTISHAVRALAQDSTGHSIAELIDSYALDAPADHTRLSA